MAGKWRRRLMNWVRPCRSHVDWPPCEISVQLKVASQETYGTLGAIVKSRTGNRQVGAVERATSFITDDLWYDIFAETFVRADGAFIPFAQDFDMSNVRTSVKGIGVIDDVFNNQQTFDLEVGQPPENWTSGVDLGRLLDLLELDLITSNESLQVALQVQINASAPGIGSAVGESSPAERIQLKDKADENFEPINLNIRQDPIDDEV
ncbi:hypothetical protein K7X08_017785 [Anisodus acutangulus]|uniref:Nal1 C-terminal domain-containing protein n=1 Tax=Anisodus acutangulus TaxID=402998 RepID=A0A9Q1LUU8_9SOLA|nr:hypothetical protein K7X08_017785 [Anisodus acutangulus]